MKSAFTPRVAKRSLVAAIAVAGVLGAGIVGIGAVSPAEPASGMHGTDNSDGHDGWGHGRWGHGGGQGGHGGGKARCEMFLDHIKDVDKKLTADQVRDIVAGKLASQGEGTLKVGKVATKSPGVVGVEIVTTSGSLVTTRDISTKTGLPVGIEKRCEDRMAGRDDHERGGHGGMHGGGFMHGLAALGPDGGERDLKLTPDQVKKIAEAYVIMTGNPRLKVGAVKEKDAKTVGVDIVTVDNALVVHRDVDRQTGRVVRPD